LMADRYGRRLPLMIDLIFFSIVEVLSGFAPNYTTFLVLRALFGIGMGAEWGVGASLVMEKVPVKLRGVFSGFLQQGYAMGYLLAAIAYWLVFPKYGWRPLFFIGGLPALLALFVRFRVKESAVWEKTKHASWRDLFIAIGRNWKIFLFTTLLSTVMIFCSHGTQDLYPTFLQREWGFTPGQRSALTVFSMVGALIGGVWAGWLSDRIGRRKSIALSLLVGVLVVPLWAFSPNIALLVAGAFLIQACVQGAWGVIPAHINELSPDGVRGFLPGFAYQCGVLFGGTIVTIQAAAVAHWPRAVVMAMSATIVFTLAASVALMGPEKKGVAYAGGPTG
jgi:SHS family lactate transporter-like MFS transporter